MRPRRKVLRRVNYISRHRRGSDEDRSEFQSGCLFSGEGLLLPSPRVRVYFYPWVQAYPQKILKKLA